MAFVTGTTIVGAGPFGLSLAAHLRSHGSDFRIIGTPMQSWRTKMPRDMLLKSAGFSSNLYDPDGSFSLRDYCKGEGIPYQDVDYPIPRETFVAYGMAFQRRFVPNVEDDRVVEIANCPGGFELRLASGTSFRSRKVVVASGIDYFRHIPEALAALPSEVCSHSADHRDLERFAGRDVAVVGGGSSASDLGILLHEAGANVTVVVRQPSLEFGGVWAGGPGGRPLWRRLRAPLSGIGPGWRSRILTEMPWVYHFLPDDVRISFARSFLGPSGGWFMKERAAGLPVLPGHQVKGAELSGNRVMLRLAAPNGEEKKLSVEHVIAATGYQADVSRLPFLHADILGSLALIGKAPRMSRHFESSIPGLYFIGAISANCFGPSMRFVVGARFAARTLARHLRGGARTAMNDASHEDGVSELTS